MTTPPFVHLHVHSEFSLVDGTLRVPELIKRVKDMGMPAVALTDHGNLFALVKFYNKALAAGIKPIIGSEVWVEGEGKSPLSHLVLLARDRTGYDNLVQLSSKGYLEGQERGQPRVSHQWLREYGQGIIALSANLEGEVGYWLARGNMEAAEAAAAYYAELFPAGFYLELQRTGRTGQEAVNQGSMEIAHRLDLPVVATNNVHFAETDEMEAHEVRVAIAEGTTLERRGEDARRHTEQNHLRTGDEMIALFEDVPEAVANAGHIAARCNVELSFGTPYLPDYQPPDGSSIEAYFPEAARDGLKERFPQILARIPEERHEEVRDEYWRRLEREIGIIDQMGFPAYFLIVADFIQWAKDNDVPVGPGRGSGAGSLVAFALKITDIDPIRYGLLFERFLNPERVSMPDFDVDFCMEKRDRVIDYVAEKYGRDKVAQIITYGAMKAKAVVRDVGRVLGHPYGYVDKIAKLVPGDLGMTLNKALEQEEDLRERYDNEEDVATLINLGCKLEGLARNAGTHAGGVLISPSTLTDFVPLFKEADGETVTSQFDKDDVEEAGLVKFDFLGLRTLTVIDKAVSLANRTRANHGEAPLDMDEIPMDDGDTFRLLQRCDTTAVFQLESSGMKELIQRLQPDRFEDLIALVALYRPGPLESGMVDDYVERRHGRDRDWDYPLPQLEPILKETYGVILYQEQVMQIAQVLGNYSLGAADLLRRAMGKKKPEEMAKQREIFLAGARENSIDDAKATYIFDLMEKFAGYGFNKSHSAAYALLSYRTAFLKAHYPAELMAAVLSSDMNNTDKVVNFIGDCRQMDIEVLPPDINASDLEFTVEDPSLHDPEGEGRARGYVRYGLGAIKGAGEAALEAILAERAANGSFSDLFELASRVDLRKANKRVAEALIRAGAMDCLAPSRAALLEVLDDAFEEGVRVQQDMAVGQDSLFGDAEPVTVGVYPEVEELPSAVRLRGEKSTLGLYLSGHPLDDRMEELGELTPGRIRDIAPAEGDNVVIAGLVASLKEINNRRGERMAFVNLEDPSGRAEVVVFAEAYGAVRDWLRGDEPLAVVEGRAAPDEQTGGYKVTAERVMTLEEARIERARQLELELSGTALGPDEVQRLGMLLADYPGNCPVTIDYRIPGRALVRLRMPDPVRPEPALLQSLTPLVGGAGMQLRFHRES
ncbi:DNA polymerase III subunit alpha [Thiohalorhabdus methylotrophus]|uniref:DNA polymerase III subunit alpha n=1 Tax=Thiohalorhabdus methylotrophus TaxID=3242694 RepID=A0ABV4TWQ0_9GAMM